MSTPWGAVQHTAEIAPGIVFYSTAGHGGIKLGPERLKQMPPYMLNTCAGRGWYEEDCDWAMPAVVFAADFAADAVRRGKNPEAAAELARKTLRNWKPEVYELFFSVTLKPGESYIRNRQLKDATAA